MVLDPSTDLLTIKEAAALLKVSEASLRRWTNAGRLECLRLGAKRERRFRRTDLLAFLDARDGGTGADAVRSSESRPSEVVLEGVAIEYGNHICALYENDLGRLKWSVPFLSDGLRGGEGCFLIASEAVREDILANLGLDRDEVEAACAGGRLVLSDGIPDGEDMCRFVEHSLVMATRAGLRTFRLLGDMTWCLDRGMSNEALNAYEMRYNHDIARRFPLVSVCQYDVRAFTGPAVLHALKCHEDTFRYPLSRFLAL